MTNTKLPFFTLLLLISFASVNAVLFTPALPDIAKFFNVSTDTAQQTITWFLVGYAIGQLLYGPIANRYGRKSALFVGIGLQIFSSLFCILAGTVHHYSLLVIGRFLLALGSGVGLKMTFTLVNECYAPAVASQKISYLMLAFAITPGLGVALGGFLANHLGWQSCFYAGAIYGGLLIFLVARLPETKMVLDVHALQIKHLIHAYGNQFKNSQLIAGGFLMGGCTALVYVFAALAPFIAMNLLGMNSAQYGLANLLPPLGLIAGSLCSAHLTKRISLLSIIRIGIFIAGCGALAMLLAASMNMSVLFSLFLPMIIIYFGMSLVIANASSVALEKVEDKAHGSAVMSFLNMASAMFAVLALGFFTTGLYLLPAIYLVLLILMFIIYQFFLRKFPQPTVIQNIN